MAAGDAVSSISSVANDAYLDIQPGSGVEWVIHNVGYAAAMELYFYDGTNNLQVDSDSAAGSRFGMSFHCTNSKYYRLKNKSGSAAALMSYDGVVTK